MQPDLLLSIGEWAPIVIGIVCAVALVGVGTCYLVRRPTGDPGQLQQAAAVGGPAGQTERDPFIYGSILEKRKASRRRGGQIAVIISRNENSTTVESGWVMNRSVTGLRLGTEATIAVGTTFNVKPQEASALVPWVPVRVIDCCEAGSTWEIGCEFLRTPPASVLMLFG